MKREIKTSLVILWIFFIIIGLCISIFFWIIIEDSVIPPIFTNLFTALLSLSFLPIRSYFYSSRLQFDLENSRDELIGTFSVRSNHLEDISEQDEAKFLRIKLLNKGNKTAKNCHVRIWIYRKREEIIHESSYLYPSGTHQLKISGESPSGIDILPNDFKIFDICSSRCSENGVNIIRFEDEFTHTRKQGKEELQLTRIYYIKLAVFGEEKYDLEKYYRIFNKNPLYNLWKDVDIEEFNWKEEGKNRSKEVKKMDMTKSYKIDEFTYLRNHAELALEEKMGIPSKIKGNEEYDYTTGSRN